MTAIVRRTPPPPPVPAAVASLLRARRLVQRNLMIYSHPWIVLVSGFFEPLFYLLGIGSGSAPSSDHRVRAGADDHLRGYVAPALLAISAMNGAMSETIFNVFFKLNYEKIYEGMLATPMGIREIAIGELLWSLMRGGLYAIAFVIMFAPG